MVNPDSLRRLTLSCCRFPMANHGINKPSTEPYQIYESVEPKWAQFRGEPWWTNRYKIGRLGSRMKQVFHDDIFYDFLIITATPIPNATVSLPCHCSHLCYVVCDQGSSHTKILPAASREKSPKPRQIFDHFITCANSFQLEIAGRITSTCGHIKWEM